MAIDFAKPLQRAIDLADGQSALADKIGTSQQNVWYWLNKAKRVPAEWAGPIAEAVGNQVTRHDLRPDIYPPEDLKAAG